ncbi:MAG: 2'-5' RNA ligase family protein [Anaerolineae bacterium]|nr:2'-5' RNA ligase family protein [Anaerolineae bacterium]
MDDQPPVPDDAQEDDLIYEDLESESWPGETGLEAIDLDALDDEIEPVEYDETTGDVLDTIETLDEKIDALPDEETVEEVPEAPAGDETVEEPDEPADEAVAEAVDEVADEETAEVEPSEPAAEIEEATEFKEADEAGIAEEAIEAPALPDMIYRVLIPLPPELAGQTEALRESAGMGAAPPPGIELAAAFRADDVGAVETALADWARAHLPAQLEITGVLAEVVGEQQYVTGWTLQPDEELQEAQHELMTALEPLITPLADALPTFHARVTIGDHIPPQPFPRLVGQMQRDFEPFVWHAETVSLLRHPADIEAGEWEETGSFR